MYIFPSFSSFPIFIISSSTTLILFSHIINVPGIIPILASIYLLLHVPNKVTNLGCVTLIILIGMSICEIRLIYDVLPKILTEFSNWWLLLVGHVFLVHYGVILFLEFGLDKLQKEDRDLFLGHCSPVLLISFPVTIATVWTMMASSFGLPLAWAPFVFQLTLFGLFQVMFTPPILPEQQHRDSPGPDHDICSDTMTETTDTNSDPDTDIDVAVDIATCLIQLAAGVLVQLLLSVYCAVMAMPRAPRWPWTVRQSLVDHVSLWSIGVLLTALLPNVKTLQSVSAKFSDIQPKHFILVSGACCYVLLLPLLHVHGIHFHTSRLVLVEMIVLGVGFSLVTAFPGRSMAVIGTSAMVLTGTLMFEMPWGIQLLPRTRLLLEWTYLGIIVMSMAGLVAQRGLAIGLSRGGGPVPHPHSNSRYQHKFHSPQSRQFEVSFLVLVTVFHVTEWNLYFTGLASTIFVFMSTSFLVAVEISLFSRGRISVTVGALIESQIFLKLLVLAMHCSTADTGRVSIHPVSVIASLVLGFVLSHSAHQQHHHQNSSRLAVGMAIIKPVTVFLSLLMMRDPIIITIVYGITGEQLLVYLTVPQCLVLALALDLVCQCRRRHKLTFFSKIQALALLVSLCSLINMTLSTGVLLLGVYWMCLHQSDERWVPARVLRRTAMVSIGLVLILAGFIGTDELSAIDVVLALPAVGSALVLEQLVRQPSTRVFRRHLKRLWLIGAFLTLLELVWAPHGGARLLVVSAHHLTVATLLARRRRLHDEQISSSSAFQDRLEGYHPEHMATALGRLQALSVVQAVIGGLIASRFAFSSPAVLALPVLVGLVLHISTANGGGGNGRNINTAGASGGYCRCEWRRLLLSRRIDVVALIVSTVGALLVLGTAQQSPLLVSSGPDVESGPSSYRLSLQLDLAVHVKAAFELGLAVLLGCCHGAMLIWAALAVAPHDCITIPGCSLPNIDYWLVGYTVMVPASLGFVFCSTSPVSVALAILSAAAGVRQLIF